MCILRAMAAIHNSLKGKKRNQSWVKLWRSISIVLFDLPLSQRTHFRSCTSASRFLVLSFNQEGRGPFHIQSNNETSLKAALAANCTNFLHVNKSIQFACFALHVAFMRKKIERSTKYFKSTKISKKSLLHILCNGDGEHGDWTDKASVGSLGSFFQIDMVKLNPPFRQGVHWIWDLEWWRRLSACHHDSVTTAQSQK